VMANRMVALLSKSFNLAELWNLRPDGTNPCLHIEKYPEKKRERYLTPDELKRLGKALAEVEREQWSVPSIIPLVRLLVLTGCRLREIMLARWEWVDFEAGTLTLPDSKTGAKIILLTPPALAVLNAIERREDNPYIIAGRKPGKHLVTPTTAWGHIRKRASLPDLRMHDLRHTFGAAGAGSGLSLPIIGALLHHKDSSSTARYSHVDQDPLRRAAETTAAALDGWLNGKSGAEVVKLKRTQ
ncbi:MAG: site-specific integrase, partial [Phycisphaerae bacterium]